MLDGTIKKVGDIICCEDMHLRNARKIVSIEGDVVTLTAPGDRYGDLTDLVFDNWSLEEVNVHHRLVSRPALRTNKVA
jgi:hypothetical protein